MENKDNTLTEMQEQMQQQMQQLREKLDKQKIVNERILKKSCSQTASRLRFKANLPILFGVAAMLLVPSLRSFGISMGFIIFTWVLMLVCIVATVLTNRHIMDQVCHPDGHCLGQRPLLGPFPQRKRR